MRQDAGLTFLSSAVQTDVGGKNSEIDDKQGAEEDENPKLNPIRGALPRFMTARFHWP